MARLQLRLDALTELPDGRLRAQRFDLVPVDFECALYVDLMSFLQRGGYVLPCARCGLPVGGDDSPHSHRQRARWRAGRSVYHPECAAEQARLRKAEWWRRRADDPAFHARERERIAQYRRSYPPLGRHAGAHSTGDER